jgi:hypothetical protein
MVMVLSFRALDLLQLLNVGAKGSTSSREGGSGIISLPDRASRELAAEPLPHAPSGERQTVAGPPNVVMRGQ